MGILGDLLRGHPVVSREGDPRVLGPLAEVWPEEREAVARAVAKRKNEYFATRHLAREALCEIAVPVGPIVNNPDRSPRWPAGVVGSLSHTDSWCGVALGRPGSGLRSLGIDLERNGCVSSDVASRILTERELAQASPADSSVRFSAKEAFYKAVFPFVRRYVGFMEVEIELLPGSGVIEARIVSPVLSQELQQVVVRGSYSTSGELCCTAMWTY